MWNKRHNENSNEKEEDEYWFLFVKYFDYLIHRAIAITTSDERQFIDSDNNSVVLLDRLKRLREFYFDHIRKASTVINSRSSLQASIEALLRLVLYLIVEQYIGLQWTQQHFISRHPDPN